MQNIGRRGLLATGGTLIVALPGRKLLAAPELPTARLSLITPPRAAPEIVFQQADGTQHTLEKFRGWGMVVNFWATWCAPCVAEMASLSVLSKTLAPHDIAVMPLSSDRGGFAVVRRFYDAQKISGLPILIDPKGEAAQAFAVRGLPTTVVIDKKGMLRAKLDGGADWSDPAVAARIRELVG